LRADFAALLHTPSLGLFDLAAAAFGLGTVVALWLAKRLKPTFPAAIVVVAVTGAISWATGYADSGGAVVGHLPQGLPGIQWPGLLGWSEYSALLMPVLVITLVSFLETASSAKVESQRSNERWNENQDLIGQGLSKISSGLCGSFATSASFSRSAINLYAGAQSGWATVFSILVVLVVLLWLTPALYYVPQSALAAIVVTAVVSLIKPATFTRLWRASRVEAVIALVTFVLTLATAPRMYWGVLAGLLMNLSHFLYQRLHPRIIELGLHPDGSLRDRHLWSLPPLAPQLLALRMDAELDFASASALDRWVMERLAGHPDIKHLCLMAQPVNRIDVTGLEAFASLHAQMLARGGCLHVSGLKLPVETAMAKAGVLPAAAGLVTYRTDAEALVALQQLSPTASHA
jgi:SulP family sulfate permease